MTKKEICDLPVADIADKNCVLFLWVTAPCLIEGIEIIKAWGFEYKTKGFCWVKKNKKVNSLFWGMGYWTRSNTEDCLIGVKGKPKRINAGVHQVVESKIDIHSKKPVIIRNKIVELCGDIPRIELFARPPKDLLFEDESYKGWDVWGNET